MNTQGSRLWIVILVVALVIICGCVICGGALYWLWVNGDRFLEVTPLTSLLVTFL